MKVRIAVLGALWMALALSLHTTAMAAQEKQIVLSGEVMKVDGAGRRITLQRSNGYKTKEVSLTVSPEAQITRGGELLTLDKLVAGEMVTASVTREKGVITAHSIRLQTGAEKAPQFDRLKKG